MTTQLRISVLSSIVLFVVSLGAPIGKVCLGQELSKQDTLNPMKVRAFLRQPGGIEKISAEVGNVILNEPEERWGEHTVDSMAKGSDLIVVAKVTKTSSSLIENGDAISTDCYLDVQDTLKGTTSEDLKITFRGGKVTLSNGFTAVLHTPVSDGVRAGNQYIFSLKRDGNVLYPVALSQSILKVNESNDIVESLANLEKDRPIVAEVSGVSVGVIENKIYVASRASN